MNEKRNVVDINKNLRFSQTIDASDRGQLL